MVPWCHGAPQAQSPVVGTTWAWKVFFWSFLTKIMQDQVPPKSCPWSNLAQKATALNFGHDFVLLVRFWDILYVITIFDDYS